MHDEGRPGRTAGRDHRRGRPRGARLGAAALLLLAVGLGACSDDDGDDATDATTTTTTTEVVTTTSTALDGTTTTEAGDDDGGDFPTPGDGCPTGEEVGELLGAEVTAGVSGGASDSDGLSYRSTGCSYRLAGAGDDDDDGEIEVERLTVVGTVPSGTTLFQALERDAADDDADDGDDVVQNLSIGEFAAFDDGEDLVVDDGPEPLRITTDDLDRPDAELAELRLRLAELALGV